LATHRKSLQKKQGIGRFRNRDLHTRGPGKRGRDVAIDKGSGRRRLGEARREKDLRRGTCNVRGGAEWLNSAAKETRHTGPMRLPIGGHAAAGVAERFGPKKGEREKRIADRWSGRGGGDVLCAGATIYRGRVKGKAPPTKD